MMDLHKQSDFAAEILEQAADAVIFSDIQGAIRFWNAAAGALFGFAAREAVGQSLDLIIPERLRSANWAGFNRLRSSGSRRMRPTDPAGFKLGLRGDNAEVRWRLYYRCIEYRILLRTAVRSRLSRDREAAARKRGARWR